MSTQVSPPPPPRTNAETLEQILVHVERLDRRDRLRTNLGLARTVIGLLPLLLFLYGTWYAITHTDELIRKVSEEAAKQAAAYTQEQSEGLLQKFLPKK